MLAGAVLIVLGAMTAAAAGAVVLDTLDGAAFARVGISGEIVERPAGVSGEAFARALMEAEGLRPWSGDAMLSPPGDQGMGTAAIVSADGHEINVKYVADDPQRPGRVCRLRFSPGVGAAQVRWDAYRWCASAFGLALPATFPPPPIETVVVD